MRQHRVVHEDPPLKFVGDAMQTWLELSDHDKPALADWVHLPHSHHARGARAGPCSERRPLGLGGVTSDGDNTVVLITGAETIAGRNLARDPWARPCVEVETPPYSFLNLEGPVTLTSPHQGPWRAAAVGRPHRRPLPGARCRGAAGRAQRRTGEVSRADDDPGRRTVRTTSAEQPVSVPRRTAFRSAVPPAAG